MKYNFDRNREYCIRCPVRDYVIPLARLAKELLETCDTAITEHNWEVYGAKTVFYINKARTLYGYEGPGSYAAEHNFQVLSIDEFCDEVGLPCPDIIPRTIHLDVAEIGGLL